MLTLRATDIHVYQQNLLASVCNCLFTISVGHGGLTEMLNSDWKLEPLTPSTVQQRFITLSRAVSEVDS